MLKYRYRSRKYWQITLSQHIEDVVNEVAPTIIIHGLFGAYEKQTLVVKNLQKVRYQDNT